MNNHNSPDIETVSRNEQLALLDGGVETIGLGSASTSDRLRRRHYTAFRRLIQEYNNPEDSEAQEWLNKLQTRVMVLVRGDSLTLSGPASQFYLNWGSSAIKAIATVSPNPTSEPSQKWLDEFEDRIIEVAQSEIHEVGASDFLNNFYSMSIKKTLGLYASPSTASESWLNELETRALKTADSSVHESSASQFLENFYANNFSMLSQNDSTSATPDQVWIKEVITRVDDAATLEAVGSNSSFLFNVYSMAIGKLSDPQKDASPKDDHIDKSLEILREGIESTAKSEYNTSDPYQLLWNVYHQSVCKLAIKYDHPTEPLANAWLDRMEEMAATSVQRGIVNTEFDTFLGVYYAGAIEALINSELSEDDTRVWLDAFVRKAELMGWDTRHTAANGEFLAEVHAIAVARLADSEAFTARLRQYLMALFLRSGESAYPENYFSLAKRVFSTRDIATAETQLQQICNAVQAPRTLDDPDDTVIRTAAEFVAIGLTQLHDADSFDDQIPVRVVEEIEHLAEEESALSEQMLHAINEAVETVDGGWNISYDWQRAVESLDREGI